MKSGGGPSTRGALKSLRQAPRNKLGRVHRLVTFLEQSESGATLREIANHLGVHTRSVKRYLNEMELLGYALDPGGHSPHEEKRWTLIAESNPARDLLPALRKLQGELMAGGNPKHRNLLTRTMRLLEAQRDELPTTSLESIYHIDHGPFAEQNPPAAILAQLEQALLQHEIIRITSESGREHRFLPYRLCLRVGVLYLLGETEGLAGMRSLAVRRIRRVVRTGSPFQPKPFNPSAFYRHSLGAFAGGESEKPLRVLLWIREEWVKIFLEKSHFDPPGRFLEIQGKPCYEVEMFIKPDFENWVISLIPAAIPLEPLVLVEGIQSRLSAGIKKLAGIPN